jgi:hypothetical protein
VEHGLSGGIAVVGGAVATFSEREDGIADGDY